MRVTAILSHSYFFDYRLIRRFVDKIEEEKS